MIKLRTDSALANLTADQQAQLYDWIKTSGYTRTIEKLAQPEPEGFGLKTFRASLHRFYVRYSRSLRQEALADAASGAGHPDSKMAARLTAEESLDHVALEIATSPLDAKNFGQVSRWLLKQKEIEQKREYLEIAKEHLALARQRVEIKLHEFQFDASRIALIHAASLRQVTRDTTKTDWQKIMAAREIIFGLKPPAEPPPEWRTDSPSDGNEEVQ